MNSGMENSRVKTLAGFVFFVTLIFISVASLINLGIGMSSEVAGFRIDYLYHFSAYLVLSISLFFWKYQPDMIKKMIVFAVMFGVFFSIVFEIIQYAIPGRVFNPLDFFSNILGFLSGIIIFFIIRKWKLFSL